MRTLGTILLLVAALVLTGCGDQAERDREKEPELLLVTMVQRGELPDLDARTVELTGGTGLAELAPPQAFEGGELPDLPPVEEGASRYAALMAGCQETAEPELLRQDGAWVARFPESDSPVNCVVADYYVAVWDVAG